MRTAIRSRFVLFFTTALIWGISACDGSAAEIRFSTLPLDSIWFSSFFTNTQKDYDIDKMISLRVVRTLNADEYIRKGVEIRIFSVQPTQADIAKGTARPEFWKNAGDCLVYLSMVIRPDSHELLRRHQYDFGPLTVSNGWLAYMDHKHDAAFYLMTVEPITADDKPSFDDQGELGGYYEFIRLRKETSEEYFKRGLLFGVKSAGQPGGYVPEQMKKEMNAFQKAANFVSATLHCYRSVPGNNVSAMRHDISSSESCISSESNTGQETSADPLELRTPLHQSLDRLIKFD